MKIFQSCVITGRIVFLLALSMGVSRCSKESAASKNIPVNAAANNDDAGFHPFAELAAWYTFDGDTKDHSGNHNDVIFNSAEACRGYAGLKNTAFRFNGAGSYMRVPNNASLNPGEAITLYAFVKPEGFYHGICHGNYIISKGNSSQPAATYAMVFSDARYYNNQQCNAVVAEDSEDFYAGIGLSGNVHDSTEYIKVNKWYKVVYTYDGHKSKIYVNGVLKNVDNHPTVISKSSNDLFFGMYENSQYPYYFNGVIDEIKIYRRALYDWQVKLL